MKVQRILINRDYYGKKTINNGYLLRDTQLSFTFYDVDSHDIVKIYKKVSYGSLWQERYKATVRDLELMWK